MISIGEVKAARKLLGWSQLTLALETGLAPTTIGSIETGKKSPTNTTLALIQSALEGAGVIFVAEHGDGPGVRLRKGK
jgi:transcriptional regulator with XRE-family HTH domain